MFFCLGDLPWKDFTSNVVIVRFGLLITLHFVNQWAYIDYETISSLPVKVRMTAAMIVITSAWANAISVFAPTMLYRGIMSRTLSVIIYVAFVFPIPQISSMWIALHPTYMEGSLNHRAAQVLYAASYGVLPVPST